MPFILQCSLYQTFSNYVCKFNGEVCYDILMIINIKVDVLEMGDFEATNYIKHTFVL